MTKKDLRSQFNELLNNPSEKKLTELQKQLKCYVLDLPACPKCKSTKIVKHGFNPRKKKKAQQYLCKKCRHIFTKSSILSKERRETDPKCPKCDYKVVRDGHWIWTLKNGTQRYKQRYHCINPKCGHYFRIKKNSIHRSR